MASKDGNGEVPTSCLGGLTGAGPSKPQKGEPEMSGGGNVPRVKDLGGPTWLPGGVSCLGG